MSIAAIITNGGVIKNNAGKLQLTANNTYSGPTTVNAGSLLVDGSQPASAVTVNGGILGGIGTTGPVTGVGGAIDPGDPVLAKAALATGPTNISSGGSYTLQIPSYVNAGVGYDQVNIAGALTLGGSSTLTVDLTGLSTTGTATNVFTYTSRIGTFATVNPINNPFNLTPVVLYGPTSISITFVSANAATHFTVSAPSSTVAGAPLTVTVTALDANNFVTAYTGTIHFTSTDTNPGVVLPADYTFTANTSASTGFDNGVHTFTLGATLITAGLQTISANDSATPTINGTSSTITVTPAAANQLVVATQPSATATAGVAFVQQPVVKLEDQYGNVVASDSTHTVTAARGTGTATLQGPRHADAGERRRDLQRPVVQQGRDDDHRLHDQRVRRHRRNVEQHRRQSGGRQPAHRHHAAVRHRHRRRPVQHTADRCRRRICSATSSPPTARTSSRRLAPPAPRLCKGAFSR